MQRHLAVVAAIISITLDSPTNQSPHLMDAPPRNYFNRGGYF
jgi:hypothetical protein